jgi:cytochrome c
MSSFEFNKIFAAILVAGIIAMLAGFIAGKLVHPHALEQDAIAIDGEAATASGGPAQAELPEPVLHMVAAADVAQGEKLSKACAACHSFDNGGPNKIGPNLWNIVGNKKGHADGFAYSEALIATGGQWSYQSLNHFLWKPKKYANGTKMNYVGLKKPEDRAAILAWLATLAPSPKAAPTDSEIAAEAAAFAPPPAPEAEAPATEDGATAPADAPPEETAPETPADAAPAAGEPAASAH